MKRLISRVFLAPRFEKEFLRLPDHIQKRLKRRGISSVGNLSRQHPVFQIDRPKEGFTFFGRIPHGNDWL